MERPRPSGPRQPETLRGALAGPERACSYHPALCASSQTVLASFVTTNPAVAQEEAMEVTRLTGNISIALADSPPAFGSQSKVIK